jgi:acyl carrier protein
MYDNDEVVISPDSHFRSLNEWDSLMQINLVMALERTFKIRFDLKELVALSSPRDIAKIVESKKQ